MVERPANQLVWPRILSVAWWEHRSNATGRYDYRRGWPDRPCRGKEKRLQMAWRIRSRRLSICATHTLSSEAMSSLSADGMLELPSSHRQKSNYLMTDMNELGTMDVSGTEILKTHVFKYRAQRSYLTGTFSKNSMHVLTPLRLK